MNTTGFFRRLSSLSSLKWTDDEIRPREWDWDIIYTTEWAQGDCVITRLHDQTSAVTKRLQQARHELHFVGGTVYERLGV